MPTSILIVDDHDLVRMGLIRMLADNEDFVVVAEVDTGEKAIESVRQFRPDLVLMDVKMPGIGGVEATKKILGINPKTKVIAVTGMSDELYADRLMKVGAAGYVTKEAGFDEILTCINKVMDGGRYISTNTAQQVAFNSITQETGKSPFAALSERELQAALFISNGAKVNDIADSLCVSTKTVNSYRYRIYQKLNISNDVELALLAIKHNLLDVE